MGNIPKDFCFLWYVNDWVGGTDLLSREQKGAYHDLLMTQSLNGHLSERQIKIKLNQEDEHYKKYWLDNDDIKKKFTIDSEGLFFNEKLEEQILKRTRFRDSRKNNLKTAPNHMTHHMEKEKGIEKEKVKRKDKKIYYTERVKLTKKEYESLQENYFEGSLKLLKLGIDKLDAYKLAHDKTYKSDAGAIRSWVAKQVMAEQSGNKGDYL